MLMLVVVAHIVFSTTGGLVNFLSSIIYFISFICCSLTDHTMKIQSVSTTGSGQKASIRNAYLLSKFCIGVTAAVVMTTAFHLSNLSR